MRSVGDEFSCERAVQPMEYDTYRSAWRDGWGVIWSEKKKRFVIARRKGFEKKEGEEAKE